MTNDLNTIGGSLQQCIDDLEENLQSKGVDAEFDISTGIRGLISEISNIEVGSESGIDITTSLSCDTLNYGNLILSLDKNIISYEDDDSCTLSATLTDVNNSPISAHPIIFEQDSEYLTTEYTNSNGVATFVLDSEQSGKMTFDVTCANLKSVSYNVIDTIIKDVNNSRNLDLYTCPDQSKGHLEIIENGKMLRRVASGTCMFMLLNKSENELTFNTGDEGLCVEFDVLEATAFRISVANVYSSSMNFTNFITDAGHYRLEIYEETFEIYKDNGLTPIQIETASNGISVSIQFFLDSSETYLKFSNLMIYPK